MTNEPSSNPTRIRWRILALLMAICFISHLNRLAMSVAGTERIIPESRLTPEQMGRVYTVYLAVYTAGMILGGWFIDRLGPRVMLLVMGVGSALFGALTGGLSLGLVGAANFLTGLLVVRGAMGLFTTPLHPACARAVSNWFPASQNSMANGLVTFAAVLGMASAGPLFGTLMDQVNWPSAFLVAAGALLVVTILWGIVGTDSPERHSSANEAERTLIPGVQNQSPLATSLVAKDRTPLLTSSLWLLAFSYAAVGYFQYLSFYWSEYYFKDVLRFSIGQSRTNTTILILALGVGMPVGGWLAGRAQRRYAGRIGWRLVPSVAMFLSAVFLFVGLAARDPIWIVVLFGLAMFALGASESSFWQAAVELGGRRGGTAAAIINTGGNGIGLLAPLLTPVISTHVGWKWGIAIGGFVGILGALCWCGIDPTRANFNSRQTEHPNA